MNKNEFMQELEHGLAGLTPDERVAALQYYKEYFDDAGPEHEAEVIAELGSPAKVAADIRAASGDAGEGWTPPERPLPSVVPSTAAPGGTYPAMHGPTSTQQQPAPAEQNQAGNTALKVFIIVLLAVFLAPLWGGLLGTFFGLVIALFVLMLVPFIIGVAFTAAGVACITASVVAFQAAGIAGLSILGPGLFLLGIGLLCCYGGIVLVAKGIPAIVRGIISLFRKLFNRPTKEG